MKIPVYWEPPPEMARGEEMQAENSAPKNYGGFRISILGLLLALTVSGVVYALWTLAARLRVK